MTYKRRKDARPAEILDAALDAFAKGGFAKTNMSAIAKRAGVSRPTLYLYFANKDEIFEALVREKLAHVIVGPGVAVSNELPAKRQLETLLRLILHKITDPKIAPLLHMLITEGPRFPAMTKTYRNQVIDPGQHALKSLIKKGVHDGSFGQHALRLDPKILVAPGLMAVVWTSLFGKFSPAQMEDMIDSYLETLMRGLSDGRQN